MQPKAPSLIRKTSPAILETHEVHSRYVSHFLGHSPVSVAERHYVTPNQGRFDEAVIWLGEQYGFSTDKQRLGRVVNAGVKT